MSKSIALEKAYKFALRIVKLYKYLCEAKHEFVLSKQILLSGTYIGSHIKEAQQGESRSTFAKEIGVALRKASETEYWLQLLRDAEYLDEKEFDSIYKDCVELIKILTAISKSSKDVN